MKNLKRALSLALATVMTLGMMVVGTGASYKDVTSKNNKEAIEVMQAVGVMIGDDKGNFNPDQKVTRNEMAVIMANLLDLNVEDYKGVAPFVDVPNWAKAYVDACYANKVVSGASANTYNGAATVTTAEAGLMVMKALGYFQYSSDFGQDWKVATIKQGSKINLFDNVSSTTNAALTRNEVAQLVLNALQTKTVEAEVSGNNTHIGAGDVTIDISATVNYTETKDDLKAVLFGSKLEKDEESYDELGRPAIEWTYDGESVGVYAAEADKVVVAKKAYDNAEEAYKDLVNKKFKGSINGDEAVKAGDVIEFFADGKDFDAVVISYELAEITKVNTKITNKQDKEDGVTAKLTIGDKVYKNTNIADYTDEYVEGAYILYVAQGDKIVVSELAESVEGKISTVKGDEVKIDGEWYTANIKLERGAKGEFYLNKAGQIVEAVAEKATKSDDYAYIYNTKSLNGVENEDGIVEEGGLKVYVVLADGTKASYVVEKDSIDEIEKNTVVAYSINKDDEFVVEQAKGEIEATELAKDLNEGYAAIATEDGKVTTSTKTEFVFYNVKDNKVKTSTATSYKNVDIEAGTEVFVVSNDGKAEYVFVMAAAKALTDDDVIYAIVADDVAAVGENEDGDEIFTYVLVIDGEETDVDFEKEQSFKNGDMISYVEGENAEVLETVEVEAANDDYYVVGGKQYNLADETIYTVSYDEDDNMDVSEGGTIEAGDMVYMVMDGKNVDTVFLFKAPEVEED